MKIFNANNITNNSVISNIRDARFVFAGFFSYVYYYFYDMENKKSLMRYGVCNA